LRSQGQEGCTTWAASGPATADGTPILAKNRDSSLEHLPLQLVVRARPEVGYRYAYVTSAGSPGIFCAGLNEAGLAVADTHVCSTDIGPGLPDYSLMMHILEEQSSVRGALDVLRSVTRLGRNNLILADAGGDLAVFEIGHENYGLVGAEDHILVNTNHFVSSSLKDHFVDTSPPALRGNSFHRYERVKSELEDYYGHIDVTLAKSLMARHGGPLDSLCRHEELGGRSVTISSTIFLPAARSLWTSFGYPCRGGYRLFSVLVLSSRRHIEGKEDEE
jgi:isopenicillin-N N-acyltransferase-like protein